MKTHPLLSLGLAALLTACEPTVANRGNILDADKLAEIAAEMDAAEEFAKLAGTSTTSSAFDNNRSWLRARGLSDYPRTGFVRATELLFPEAS